MRDQALCARIPRFAEKKAARAKRRAGQECARGAPWNRFRPTGGSDPRVAFIDHSGA